MREKNDLLNGDRDKILTKINMPAAKYYKYCTLISVDIKRTFSAFKLVLDNKRQNLINLACINMYCNKITHSNMKIVALCIYLLIKLLQKYLFSSSKYLFE